jgi:hypothetical protein
MDKNTAAQIRSDENIAQKILIEQVDELRPEIKKTKRAIKTKQLDPSIAAQIHFEELYQASTQLPEPVRTPLKKGVKYLRKKAATPPKIQKFPQSSMIIATVLSLLFIIVYIKALAKKTGRECGRGWFALMLLPFVIGYVYIFVGRYIAYSNDVVYSPQSPVGSMILYSLTLMVFQYFVSAFLIAKHTYAPIGASFKKAFLSIIYVGISCALTIMSFIAFRYIIKNSKMIKTVLKGIPVVGWIIYIVIKVFEWVWKIVDMVPALKRLYTIYIHLLPAFGFGNFVYIAWIPIVGLLLAPIALFIPFTPLAALGGHGMACEITRKQFPNPPK